MTSTALVSWQLEFQPIIFMQQSCSVNVFHIFLRHSSISFIFRLRFNFNSLFIVVFILPKHSKSLHKVCTIVSGCPHNLASDFEFCVDIIQRFGQEIKSV
ncbi:hypothetical protein CRENBAI_011364 [Crenichthys baileyi]|uniref:Uncharacterized protein n=1 Tax=Crenichthys baileyi TaxID=28760 RepID=A0AAV9RDM6_9TELE